eukprot:jgi/Botrbrau1/15124/Bobra.0283s0003.1
MDDDLTPRQQAARTSRLPQVPTLRGEGSVTFWRGDQLFKVKGPPAAGGGGGGGGGSSQCARACSWCSCCFSPLLLTSCGPHSLHLLSGCGSLSCDQLLPAASEWCQSARMRVSVPKSHAMVFPPSNEAPLPLCFRVNLCLR